MAQAPCSRVLKVIPFAPARTARPGWCPRDNRTSKAWWLSSSSPSAAGDGRAIGKGVGAAKSTSNPFQ